MNLLYIAFGGALGSVARFLMMSLVGRLTGNQFPYGTLAVNILGSFMMGVLVGALARFLPANQADLRLLFGVGVLGGFTTFSAFSLDIVTLMERGEMVSALFYIVLSVILSVLALMAGAWLLRGGMT